MVSQITDKGGDVDLSRAIGHQVQQWRTKRGWSLRELVDRLRDLGANTLGKDAVMRIEHGRRAVSVDEAVLLADVLDVPLMRLLVPLDRDHVRVGDRDVAPWALVAWVDGDEPFPGRDARRYHQAAAPLDVRQEVRALAEQAAEAAHRRDQGDTKASADVYSTFSRLRELLNEVKDAGMTTEGLVPPWMSARFHEWSRGTPDRFYAGFVREGTEVGLAPGQGEVMDGAYYRGGKRLEVMEREPGDPSDGEATGLADWPDVDTE